jgi:hypothetical protein
MNDKRLIEGLASSVGDLPTHVEVIGLQRCSLDDLHRRTKRFLSLVGDKEQRSLDRGDWVAQNDHTVVYLTQGAYAIFYHASGAMKYVSGFAPMEALFEQVESRALLTKLVNDAAQKLNLHEWAGPNDHIAFERLWQMKAQAADRQGNVAEPVLCRIVGAYRHFVGGIPVLGGASVAVKLAGNGALDSLSVHVRASASETIDKAKILPPEMAARQVLVQLGSLLGHSKDALPRDVIESQTMQFGYLDLGKRKAQRLLAPAYVAHITLRHQQERQAYRFAVSASEKSYLPIYQGGHEALPTVSRSAHALNGSQFVGV